MGEDKTEKAWQKLLYAHPITVLKSKTNKKARLNPYIIKATFTLILQCRHKKLIFHLSQGSIVTSFFWGRGEQTITNNTGTLQKRIYYSWGGRGKVYSVVSNELLSDGIWTEEMETTGKEGHKMERTEKISWGCQNFLKCS